MVVKIVKMGASKTEIQWCLLQSRSTIACHLQGKFSGTMIRGKTLLRHANVNAYHTSEISVEKLDLCGQNPEPFAN